MAGNANSGRRTLVTTDGDWAANLPKLRKTESSILKFCDYVVRGLALGLVDRAVAETLIAGARTALASIKSRKADDELAELKRLTEQVDAMDRAGLEHEVAERQHSATSCDKCGRARDKCECET